MKSNNSVLISYYPLFDDILKLDKATIKNFDIENIICLNYEIPFELNPYNHQYINKLCKERNYNVFKTIKNILFLDIKSTPDNKKVRYLDYEQICYNYFLSIFREESYINSKKIKKQIKTLSTSCKIIEMQIENFLKKNNFDKVFLFNTRLPTSSAISQACKKLGIEMINYDLLANARIHYSKNKTFFHPEGFKEAIEKEFQNIQNEKLIKFGAKFILYRQKKKFIAYKVFNKRQVNGKLPERAEKKFICVLTNSVDEAKYYTESYGFIPLDQTKEIDNIINICKNLSIQVIVRIHPNSSNSQQEQYLYQKYNGSRNLIIKGDSECDTYQLLKSSIANISFGSSTGLESILLNQPSYIIGPTLFQEVVKYRKFDSASACIEEIINHQGKETNSIQMKLDSCKWFAYISGEFCEEFLKRRNIELSKKNFRYKFLHLIWRLERILSYPINFNLIRVYKIFRSKLK
ncbi:MAG: hypothetical protein JJ846_007895 [Prochlorococcus marinus CUG1437]|nr:hypothetical protein [Prochlorococcus marinus CUG1437]